MSIWTGLGTSGAIIQDGYAATYTGSVGEFHLWFEYWPDFEQPDPFTLPANVGDQIWEWAWEGDEFCTWGAGHTGWGCFMYTNLSTNPPKSTPYAIPIPAPNGIFDGATAEQIVERPSPSDNPGYALAFFNNASSQMFAFDNSGASHDHTTDPYEDITMRNSFDSLIATSASTGQNGVVYTWKSGAY